MWILYITRQSEIFIFYFSSFWLADGLTTVYRQVFPTLSTLTAASCLKRRRKGYIFQNGKKKLLHKWTGQSTNGRRKIRYYHYSLLCICPLSLILCLVCASALWVAVVLYFNQLYFRSIFFFKQPLYHSIFSSLLLCFTHSYLVTLYCLIKLCIFCLRIFALTGYACMRAISLFILTCAQYRCRCMCLNARNARLNACKFALAGHIQCAVRSCWAPKQK